MILYDKTLYFERCDEWRYSVIFEEGKYITERYLKENKNIFQAIIRKKINKLLT
jgi:hypothetical protein